MRENDKISVIIPCYNVAKWVDRCLESITSQTIGLDRLEIICVDDCSTDDTFMHLEAWEVQYPDQFVLVKASENSRQGGARNIGLSYATGDWIAFVDSDDWVEREYLELLLQPVTEEKYDVVCCESIRDDSTELSYLEEIRKKGEGENRKLSVLSVEDRKAFIHAQSMKLSAWAKLIRRSFLLENDIVFPENLAYEDIFWGELLHLYVRNVFLRRERLYHYFINSESTVLGQSFYYHTDMLTIQSLLFHEIKKRGMDTEYGTELEYEYLYTGLLAFLKVLALRFEEPPYPLFLLLQAFTVDHYPNLKDNAYIKRDGLPPLHDTLLQAAFMPIRKTEFLELMRSLKQIGI
ncbi:MAG: glycosyltransferase [Lachnospiraceae bacterium]|nr:glycosyltransferase [Lachnospiraceae bacterium]